MDRNAGFVYVGKDLDNPAHFLKIGLSTNPSRRLKAYRTAQPNFFFLITIQTADMRKLELSLHQEFKDSRKGSSEVFLLEPFSVEKSVERRGYRKNANGVYSR